MTQTELSLAGVGFVILIVLAIFAIDWWRDNRWTGTRRTPDPLKPATSKPPTYAADQQVLTMPECDCPAGIDQPDCPRLPNCRYKPKEKG